MVKTKIKALDDLNYIVFRGNLTEIKRPFIVLIQSLLEATTKKNVQNFIVFWRMGELGTYFALDIC